MKRAIIIGILFIISLIASIIVLVSRDRAHVTHKFTDCTTGDVWTVFDKQGGKPLVQLYCDHGRFIERVPEAK